MRQCPKCQTAFQVIRKTFAEIDSCPSCGGMFLDPGEGVAVHGAAAELSFLLQDGRARFTRTSDFTCPVTTHVASSMNVYTVGTGQSAIEIDVCPVCGGCFLDHDEGVALTALEEVSRDPRFAAPPPMDRHTAAVDAVRSRQGRGFFADFVLDMVQGTARVLDRSNTSHLSRRELQRRLRAEQRRNRR